MINDINRHPIKLAAMAAVITLILVFYGALPALSHGGKTHSETDFSSLQAVQKAIELYDRLITAGKLAVEWETGLTTIMVRTRATDKQEHIVQFKRSEGDPGSVYFFFDQKGDYSGSNFTGK